MLLLLPQMQLKKQQRRLLPLQPKQQMLQQMLHKVQLQRWPLMLFHPQLQLLLQLQHQLRPPHLSEQQPQGLKLHKLQQLQDMQLLLKLDLKLHNKQLL